VFCFQLEERFTDPGRGDTFTVQRGCVSLAEVNRISELWARAKDFLKNTEVNNWIPILKICQDWVYIDPGISQHTPDEVRERIQEIAKVMLQDVFALASNHPGVVHKVLNLSEVVGIDIGPENDPFFEVLFPSCETDDIASDLRRQANDVQRSARQWSRETPAEIVPSIARCEIAADEAGVTHPRHTPYLCRLIAEQSDHPSGFLSEFMKLQCKPDLIEMFLWKAVSNQEGGWEEFLEKCLDSDRYQLVGLSVILTIEDISEGFLRMALVNPQLEHLSLETMIMRSSVPESTVARLLSHEDDAIAGQAAVGEWHRDPKGEIRASLRERWRSAVNRLGEDKYSLVEIFSSHPDLAYPWLRNFISKEGARLWHVSDSVHAAIRVLSCEERWEMLMLIPKDYCPGEITKRLVGNDHEIYRDLLSDRTMKVLHLEPLEAYPTVQWAEMAMIALDFGYGIEDVVCASLIYEQVRAGMRSDSMEGKVKAFEGLASHENEKVGQIGQLGAELARKHLQRELESERREDIRGSW